MKKLFTSIFILLLSTQISWSQSFVSINPNSGLQGQTLNTIVTGSNFDFLWSSVPGTWGDFYLKQNSYSILPNSVVVIDNDNLNVEWTIPQSSPLGLYSVEWDYYNGWLPPITIPGGFFIGGTGVSGKVFFDGDSSLTQNGIEQGLFNQKIILLPDSVITFTLQDGSYIMPSTSGTKDVKILPNPPWKTTTDSSVNVIISNNIITGIDFGLKGIIDTYGIDVTITGTSVPRCNWQRKYIITYTNTGTVFQQGDVTYIRDSSVTYDYANPVPDNITGNFYTWNYDSLHPGESRNIEIFVTLPAGGVTFSSGASATAMDTLNVVQDSDGEEIIQTTACSFDPNDKTVFPRGVQAANYTLMSDTLDFLIRFQNTGNDTAFRVVLLDTLDKDILDLNSFSLISYSHPVITELQTNGALSFTFDNILLPDSNVNEPASNGFVRFRCLINH